MKQGVNFVAMRPLPFYVTRLQRPQVLWPLPFRELLSPSLSGQGWLVWIGKKGDEALVYRTGQKATSRQRGHIYKSKLFIHLSQLTYVPCGKIKPSGSQREGDQDLWIPKHSTLLGSPAFSLVNLRSKGLLLPNSAALWIKSSNAMCPWRIFNQHKQVHSPFILYYLE